MPEPCRFEEVWPTRVTLDSEPREEKSSNFFYASMIGRRFLVRCPSIEKSVAENLIAMTRRSSQRFEDRIVIPMAIAGLPWKLYALFRYSLCAFISRSNL
jgi:hypothetical protein